MYNHSIYNYTTGSIEFNELYPVIERAINYSCLKMNCIKLIKPLGSFSKINYETKAIYLLKNEQSLQYDLALICSKGIRSNRKFSNTFFKCFSSNLSHKLFTKYFMKHEYFCFSFTIFHSEFVEDTNYFSNLYPICLLKSI